MSIPTEEALFISGLDADSPWTDPVAAIALIKRACLLSSNAAFTIPYVLGVQSRSARTPVESDTLLLLLEIWEKLFQHPLKTMVLQFARAMVRGEALSEQLALDAMDVVAKYPGEYQALNTVYFSQRSPTQDIDAVYDEIQSVWAEED